MRETTFAEPRISADPRSRRPEYHPRLQEIILQRENQSTEYVASREERTRYVERHAFAFSMAGCSDGRLSDANFALGLLPGQLKSFRCPGSKEATCEDDTYLRRFLAHHELVRRGLGLVPGKRLAQIHLSMAHCSGSSEALGCGAWEGNTRAYLDHMSRLSDEINQWKNDRVVAVNGIIDTDDDSFRFIGPTGHAICASTYMQGMNGFSPGDFHERIVVDLERAFPARMAPVSLLDRSLRERFYAELADRIVANLAFIRNVKENERPIEALDHQERMIFIGRPLETRDRNEAFLIEDRGNIFGDGLSHLKLALKYVVPNCIVNDPEHWVVPIFIAIPHNGEDQNLVRLYALGLRRNVAHAVCQYAAWVAKYGHFPKDPSLDVAREIERLENELPRRVVICTTIHDRADRHPVSVDPIDQIR